MKYSLLCIAAAVLAAGSWNTRAAPSTGDVVATARTTSETSEFEFSAARLKGGGADIVIRCTDGCPHGETTYRENTGYSPGWVLLPRDGSTRFISVWTSGSAYAVMVHDIGGPRAIKVLEAGSRVPPAVALDDQGNEVFQLCTEEAGCNEYHWQDGKYAVRFVRKWARADAAK